MLSRLDIRRAPRICTAKHRSRPLMFHQETRPTEDRRGGCQSRVGATQFWATLCVVLRPILAPRLRQASCRPVPLPAPATGDHRTETTALALHGEKILRQARPSRRIQKQPAERRGCGCGAPHGSGRPPGRRRDGLIIGATSRPPNILFEFPQVDTGPGQPPPALVNVFWLHSDRNASRLGYILSVVALFPSSPSWNDPHHWVTLHLGHVTDKMERRPCAARRRQRPYSCRRWT